MDLGTGNNAAVAAYLISLTHLTFGITRSHQFRQIAINGFGIIDDEFGF
jgi:hypothetical protein